MKSCIWEYLTNFFPKLKKNDKTFQKNRRRFFCIINNNKKKPLRIQPMEMALLRTKWNGFSY